MQIAQHATHAEEAWITKYRVIPILVDSPNVHLLTDRDFTAEELDEICFLSGLRPIIVKADKHIDMDFLLEFASTRAGACGKKTQINCPPEIRFECPSDWHNLQETENAAVRYCNVCEQNVMLCTNQEQLDSAQKGGLCVAVVIEDPYSDRGTYVGQLDDWTDKSDIDDA